MADTLLYLSYIGVILLIGLLFSILARKFRIPNLLLLILVGITIGNITYNGQPLISFPLTFLTSIAILTLVMIIFDASSRFKLREFDTLSFTALKLALIFLILNATALTYITHKLYTTDIQLALIFAVVVSGTSPTAMLTVLKGAKSKVFSLLEIESIINTPLIVLIPFLILGAIGEVQQKIVLTQQIVPFAQQFITGIGAGVLIGLVVFKIMRKKYSPTLSPLAILTVALLTYVIAESIGGNGVLAVTTAGLVFGNVYVVHKRKLQEFSATFALILEILVFVLIGLIIKIPLTAQFFLFAFYLFGIGILIRFLSVQLALYKSSYTLREKIFMSLNIPKGIAVAVIVFTLATKAITGIKPILDLILIFMLYSLVLSTIVTRLSKYFTKVEIIEK